MINIRFVDKIADCQNTRSKNSSIEWDIRDLRKTSVKGGNVMQTPLLKPVSQRALFSALSDLSTVF